MQQNSISTPTVEGFTVPVTKENVKESNRHAITTENDDSVLTPPKRSRTQSAMIVAASTGTQILSVATATGVSTALPSIARDLHMSSYRIPWIISAFTLSSGCLLLLFGRLADIYGRKRVWFIGGVWTIAMTLGCSLAQTDIQLITLRAMAGLGPAATVPAAIGILARSFPPSRARSTAFATFSAGAPIGGALGQILGGVLSEYSTWRSLFYFLTGLGTAVLIAGIFAIDQDPKAQTDNDQVDWIGAFVITSGLTLTTFALTDASSASWSSPLILSLLVLGITFIGLFLAWEYYLVHHTSFPPLMPLDIWARDHGRFAAMQVVSAMEWACFMNFGMYAMLYYQNYLGLSPLLAVCRFLPMHVTGMICNIIVIFVVDTINGAYLLGFGVAATITSALLFAFIDTKAPYWQYGFPAVLICVIGADFSFAIGTLYIAKIAHEHEQSVAGAILQTISSVGTSFGFAVSTLADIAGMQNEAKKSGIIIANDGSAAAIPAPVLLKGYRTAQLAGAMFGAFGLLITIVFLHGIGIVGTKRTSKRSAEAISEQNEKSPSISPSA